MKRVGKYLRKYDSDIKPVYYKPQKHIPENARKVLVFGEYGTGKSYNLIAEVIKNNDNVLYISHLSAEIELKYMPPIDDITITSNLTDIKDNFTGKIAYDLGLVPEALQREYFYKEVLPYIENIGLTTRSDITLVLDNMPWVMADEDLVNKLSESQCKVILNWSCHRFDAANGDIDCFLSRRNTWTLIPVFTRLYKKEN